MANQAGEVLFINTSGQFFLRQKGREAEVIGRDQKFMALPEEIPQAFHDTILPITPIVGWNQPELQDRVLEGKPLPQVISPVYTVKPGKVPGQFNVVDARGKALNEKPLDAEAAKAMVERLMSD